MKKSMFLSISLATCISTSAFALDAPVTPAAPAPAAVAAPAPGVDSHSHGVTPAAGVAAPAAAPAVPAEPAALSGKVIQTMNAAGYSYIYIEQSNGKKQWVAVSQTPVKEGDQVAFKPGIDMGQFSSPALNRTFDSIVFTEIDRPAPVAQPDPGKNQGVSPGSGGAAKGAAGKISVPKATGANAFTVAEAYSKSAKLNKKPVTIRGQVVKVSTGIMSKNWIHIQDGTGSEKTKTHNLVCTSKDATADVGDIVTISGTLIKDRDFGAGYKYPVIIEDTKITK